MISPTTESIRLFLHVIAASVWVGGQLVLGGLVPQVRKTNPEALQTIARAFGRVAWPAFGLAVVTGMWNLVAVDPAAHGTSFMVTFAVKIGLVVVAAVATLAHSGANSKLVLALGGAVSLLASLAVMYLGVLLTQAG